MARSRSPEGDARYDRNGTVLTYAYTPTGTLAGITYPDQSQTVYSYDSLDRLTQVKGPLGTTSITYDPDGRIKNYTDLPGLRSDIPLGVGSSRLSREDRRGNVAGPTIICRCYVGSATALSLAPII